MRNEDAKRFGVPLIFTEFGACFDGQECINEINSATDAFDTALASWSYWMYKGFGDFTTTGGSTEGLYEADGSLQNLKAKALARTYAWSYQGTPKSMFFSTEDSSFTTTFELNSTVSAPTEVFAHADYWYSQGFKISAETTNG